MEKMFDLKVGFTCNNNCVHCVVTDKKDTKDLSTQQIKDIIDGVDAEYDIVFTGGEATIRFDFIEIVKYAKEKGHKTNLQTNGTMFYDEEFTKEVAKYLDSLLIAIHSHIPEIHNAIVGCEGSDMYSRTIEGFKNIIKYGIQAQTQTVISALNIANLPETYDFIQSISPGIFMNLTYPHPNGNAMINADKVVVKYSNIKQYIHKILKKWAKYIFVEAIPYCYLYPYHNDVGYNFDNALMIKDSVREGFDPANKYSNCFNKDGNITNYHELMLSEKRKIKKCNDCVFNPVCAGVWKEYIEIHKNKLDLFPVRDLNCKSGAIIIYGKAKCLNTCVFCSGNADPNNDENRFETFLEDSKYFIENHFNTIEISGGDPGEFTYLPEAILYLKENGIDDIILSTHGRTLSNESFVERLALSGLDRCRIPLYGSTAEVHNKTCDPDTENSQAFNETIQGIKNCVKHGIKICGQTVINNYNKDDIVDIINLYKDVTDCFMKEMIVNISYISSVSKDYTRDWYIPIQDLSDSINKIIDANIQFSDNIQFLIFDVPYCVIGKYNNLIEFTSAPNLGTHKVEEGNRSDVDDQIPHYRIKTYFEECDKCSLKEKCGGIPKNDLLMFGVEKLKAIGE